MSQQTSSRLGHLRPARRGQLAKNEGNAWLYPGGVAELRERLVERGLSLAAVELRCLIEGMKGPLVEGALEEARAAARSFAETLPSTA